MVDMPELGVDRRKEAWHPRTAKDPLTEHTAPRQIAPLVVLISESAVAALHTIGIYKSGWSIQKWSFMRA
jgi:hypothetical protein